MRALCWKITPSSSNIGQVADPLDPHGASRPEFCPRPCVQMNFTLIQWAHFDKKQLSHTLSVKIKFSEKKDMKNKLTHCFAKEKSCSTSSCWFLPFSPFRQRKKNSRSLGWKHLGGLLLTHASPHQLPCLTPALTQRFLKRKTLGISGERLTWNPKQSSSCFFLFVVSAWKTLKNSSVIIFETRTLKKTPLNLL